MVLRFNLKRLLLSLALPLLVGGFAAVITRDNMDLYSKITKPPLAPPSWLFPLVWTILYILMGVSLYLVWDNNANQEVKYKAFLLFGIQLFLNGIWSPVFFNNQQFLLSLIILVALCGFTIGMIITFYKISKPSGILQIPYFIWLVFAGYLNLAICLIN